MLRSQHWGNPSSSHYYGVQVASGGPILVDEISPGRLVLLEHWWSQKLTESATMKPVPELHDSWWLATWHDSCKEKHRFLLLSYLLFFFFQKLISPELWLSSASFCKAKKAIETARRRWLNSAEFPNQMIAKVHQTGKTIFSELMFYVEQHARVYILVRLDIGNKLLQVQETCLIHVLSIYAYPSVFICVISSVHIYIYT